MKTTIDMAREAEVSLREYYDETGSTLDVLRRFEALVRADEREVCAQMVEEYPHWLGMTAKAEIANAIRNRGNT
jgi:outer membrane protein assembly factor BamD (BamD/ComL family)